MELQDYPLAKRMEWWAAMNAWGWPEDYPIQSPWMPDCAESFTGSEWQRLFSDLSLTLTPAAQSLGWWLHALGKTQDEWREWWANGNGRKREDADKLIESLTTPAARAAD